MVPRAMCTMHMATVVLNFGAFCKIHRYQNMNIQKRRTEKAFNVYKEILRRHEATIIRQYFVQLFLFSEEDL